MNTQVSSVNIVMHDDGTAAVFMYRHAKHDVNIYYPSKSSMKRLTYALDFAFSGIHGHMHATFHKNLNINWSRD